MFCLYILPIGRPAQAKIQMFMTRWRVIRSNLLSLIKFSRLYLLKSLVTFWVSRMLTDKTSNIKSNFVYHLRNTAMPIHFRLTFYAESSQHCSIFAQTFFFIYSGQHASFRRSKSATQNNVKVSFLKSIFYGE